MTAQLTSPSTPHPPKGVDGVPAPPLVCPLCKGGLDEGQKSYSCRPCAREFPIVDGVPDFRVFPDPYLDFQADLERTQFVLQQLHDCDFAELLHRYWDKSDTTPPALRTRFIRSASLSESRSRRVLRILRDETFSKPVGARRVLEIGSGTGGFLLPALGKFEQVVGVDIAMRWLHVSRRRFLDAGVEPPQLVCCCAEHLPFPDGSFDLAVGCSMLEFAHDPDRVVGEASRVLTSGGSLFVNTVNRYSAATDPYCSLWGVGFLPRAWQARYVSRRRNADYSQVRLLSFNELSRLGRRHFERMEWALPDVDDDSLSRLPRSTQRQVHVYRMLQRCRMTRSLLRAIGPSWDVKLTGPRP